MTLARIPYRSHRARSPKRCRALGCDARTREVWRLGDIHVHLCAAHPGTAAPVLKPAPEVQP